YLHTAYSDILTVSLTTLFRSRVTFSGELEESPMSIEAVRRPNASNRTEVEVKIHFHWPKWASQPMLSLAYFTDLKAFLSAKSFEIGRAHVCTPVTSGPRMPSS